MAIKVIVVSSCGQLSRGLIELIATASATPPPPLPVKLLNLMETIKPNPAEGHSMFPYHDYFVFPRWRRKDTPQRCSGCRPEACANARGCEQLLRSRNWSGRGWWRCLWLLSRNTFRRVIRIAWNTWQGATSRQGSGIKNYRKKLDAILRLS